MNQIIPECNVDTAMIETFVPPKKRYNHQKGCPNVAKTMLEDFGDSFALGIIDKDKVEIGYLQEFELKKEVAGSLELWRHKDAGRHHYFIKICPAAEVWIMNRVAELNLDIGRHNLPAGLKALRKEAKQTATRDDKRFRDLFAEMKRGRNEVIETLINWVAYLRDKSFAANIDEL